MSTAHGIYEFTGSEMGAPGADFFAPLTDSIEDAFVAVDAAIAAIDTQTDGGWVPITTFQTGYAATAGHIPRVRRVGDRVDLFGAVTRSGSSGTTNFLTIPPGFRLAGTYLGTTFVGSSVQSNGIALNLTLNGADHILGMAYGSLGAGVVVPLIASWYVN